MSELEKSNSDVEIKEIYQLHFDINTQTLRCPFVSGQRITANKFRQFMLSLAAAAVSDVTLQSDLQPRIETNGTIFKLAGRVWTGGEIENILEETYGAASGVAEIRALKSLDYSYEILSPSGHRQRFRVNATGIYGLGGFGIELTFRVLPTCPPSVNEVGLSPLEINFMTPRNGLVIIAGATGSGKSTTMAAITRYLLETHTSNVKIVDIQAPIEYIYSQVMKENKHSASLIGQSEIGLHAPDFASGIRSALRRKPHIIMIGEARDQETISVALEAALTGHLVYTTTHASSVHDCVRRLLTAFPSVEREHKASDLGTSLRFVMAQQLVPDNSHRGRVALREWMSFQHGISNSMLSLSPNQWPKFILDCQSGINRGKEFKQFTQSYEQAASTLRLEGKITPETNTRIINQKL